ncbi:MAG: gfo/Idh/MocA family oxidoreductase, partial [Siphonobacter sp.]
HYGGGAGEKTPQQEVPRELDWDMWCGPAPMIPYHPGIHPKGFRLYLDYANGQLGDWGIHWMDQILWWSEDPFPRKIFSMGGRAIRRDSTDAPDHQVAIWKFDDFTVEWEHRLFAANEAERTNVGCYFYGTEGTFHMGWLDGWTFYPANRNKPVIHQEPQLDLPDQQNIAALWRNFLDCIESGNKPICDIEIGQRSTNMALLGMLSYKLGQEIDWDGEKEIITNNAEANKLLRRDYRGSWEYPKA